MKLIGVYRKRMFIEKQIKVIGNWIDRIVLQQLIKQNVSVKQRVMVFIFVRLCVK